MDASDNDNRDENSKEKLNLLIYVIARVGASAAVSV